MKHGMPRLAAALFAACALTAQAGQISVRAFTRPERPYAGEDFRVVVEVEAGDGENVELVRLSGLPAALSVSQFAAEGVKAAPARDGEVRRITTFSAVAVASRPMDFVPRLGATLNVTSLKGGGFFQMKYVQAVTVPVSFGRLSILALPPAPPGFSGAIGRFSLDLVATPREVAPGDVVELKLTLSGSGHLGDALPEMPSLDPALFRAYPPSSRPGEGETATVVVQSIVPLSTNSVIIGSATFPFFDAQAGVYTNASTAPLRLVLAERVATEEPAVREIEIGTSGRATAGDVDVASLLHSRRGAFALEGGTVLRVAPGRRAKAIMELPAGTPVIPLESADGFMRVEARGRTGWIPAALDRRTK